MEVGDEIGEFLGVESGGEARGHEGLCHVFAFLDVGEGERLGDAAGHAKGEVGVGFTDKVAAELGVVFGREDDAMEAVGDGVVRIKNGFVEAFDRELVADLAEVGAEIDAFASDEVAGGADGFGEGGGPFGILAFHLDELGDGWELLGTGGGGQVEGFGDAVADLAIAGTPEHGSGGEFQFVAEFLGLSFVEEVMLTRWGECEGGDELLTASDIAVVLSHFYFDDCDGFARASESAHESVILEGRESF